MIEEPLMQVGDVPCSNETLMLRCVKCGTEGQYRFGRIVCDPHEDAGLGFSGIVRCRKCNSSGDWDFDPDILPRVEAWTRAQGRGEHAPLLFGEMRTFDGVPCRFGGQAEDHLLALVKASPRDGHLWRRLGNLYDQAEDEVKAAQAFEKAIELDPTDIEAQHSLACIEYARGDFEKGGRHFHEVLRHAGQVRDVHPHMRRTVVESSIDNLIDIHEFTGGTIPITPPESPSPAGPDAPGASMEAAGHIQHLHVQALDLSKPRDRRILADMYLGDFSPRASRGHKARTRRPAEKRPTVGHALSWQGEKPSRNAPCPCGSGRHFKRCCASAWHAAHRDQGN